MSLVHLNRVIQQLIDAKAGGRKDWTRLPVPNFSLCHWSSQLCGLRPPSSLPPRFRLVNLPIKNKALPIMLVFFQISSSRRNLYQR